MVFGTIIEIDDQGGDLDESGSHALPPLNQPIHQTVAGHLRGHAVDKQFIVGRHQDADGCYRRQWFTITVGGLGGQATLPATRKGTDLDCCFRIHGDS